MKLHTNTKHLMHGGHEEFRRIFTCPQNVDDVLRIGRSAGILFFHSGQPIGSVDIMCLRIGHVPFLDFLDCTVV